MWFSLLYLVLLQAPAVNPPPPVDAPPRAARFSASNLELVTDERDSLKGVSGLAVTIQLPDTVVPVLNPDALKSTVVFQLEQAGLVVTPTRELEEPLLAITVRTVQERDARGDTGRLIYRVYADLLQLVRLADRNGVARLMMASTWHAGSFGALSGTDIAALRPRVAEVIDAFIADHRTVNPAPEAAPAPAPAAR